MSTLSSTKSCYGVSGKLWGNTQTVFADDNSEVALARIKKGGYCSMHFHRRKWNRFVVISGKLEVILDKGHCEDIIELREGMATDVPPGIPHRFNCTEDCVCLEIYWIDPLDLNDIERKDNGGMNLADKGDKPSRAEREGVDVQVNVPRGQEDHLVLTTRDEIDKIVNDKLNKEKNHDSSSKP